MPPTNATAGKCVDEVLPLKVVERRAIERALEEHHGNRTSAARALGVSHSSVHGWYHDAHEPMGATRRVVSDALDAIDAETPPPTRR